MKFTEDHEALRATVRKFIDREINPYVDSWEEAQMFPAKELFPKLGKAGLLGVSKPTEYGGMGLDYSYSMVMAEELGHIHCGGVPLAIGVHTDMCTPALAKLGSDELRKEFLTPSIAGDLIGCIGVSETGAGSDVASLKTTARKDGGDYVISGSKMWITNGIQADWMCCLANTSDGKPHENKSLIVVPLNTKGVSRARKLHKLGMWSSDTAEIYFDEVRVPQRYRIGDEGHGFLYQMLQFQEERLWGAANAIGGFEDAIKLTIDYTRERIAFGKPILHNQVVHFKLAELSTEVEALRALVYRAGELYLSGQDVTRLASMAKVKAGRLGRELADSCLQYWGGMGYMWESRIARIFRDVRLISIGGGADEIMLSIICRLEGTLPRGEKR
jgi:citronellyl-CoA dehydrogenase